MAPHTVDRDPDAAAWYGSNSERMASYSASWSLQTGLQSAG
jgi:hypothetical protein